MMTGISTSGPLQPPQPSPVPPYPDRKPPSDDHNTEKNSILRHPKLPPLNPDPVLRLHCNELAHPASKSFLSLVNASTILPTAINSIRVHLYSHEGHIHNLIPSTRSVTLILRSMGGVAYTTGTPIDNEHKEIHFSLQYIQGCTDNDVRRREEIIGVVTHEMVHCYQYDGEGTAPGGLIEGIADYVRLKEGLAPPHWNPHDKGDRWDAGYQHTAYFLVWLDETFGSGSVVRVNAALREKYDEGEFWKGLFGKTIDHLWAQYRMGIIL